MGRAKKPDGVKLEKKTFCIEKEIKDWLVSKYGRGCHAVVRDVLREHYEKEKSRGG